MCDKARCGQEDVRSVPHHLPQSLWRRHDTLLQKPWWPVRLGSRRRTSQDIVCCKNLGGRFVSAHEGGHFKTLIVAETLVAGSSRPTKADISRL